MIISFLWIACMQWFAKIMVWFSIAALIVLNGVGLYYCVTRYYELKDNEKSDNSTMRSQTLTEYNFQDSMKSQLDSYLANKRTWLAFSIICASILIILILILVYLRNRIRLAIALIIEASRSLTLSPITSNNFY
jgi:choline transporter-like protein 2/4/5